MTRIAWFTLLLAALAAFAIRATGGTSSTHESSAACDIWLHEPLVAFDVTGFTFAGPVDESLHVYDDGVVKRFSASHGKAIVAYVTPTEARVLLRDLLQAGASSLCDDPLSGADIPLKTLTVFRGKADALAHTVNWWTDAPPYLGVRQILDAFIAAHVP